MHEDDISLTAWVVVASQLLLRRLPRWDFLVSDDNASFYEKCAEYCRRYSSACRLLGSAPWTFQLWLLERMLAMGVAQHFAFRKQAIARQVNECIQNGFSQLVVIGGGFDRLALDSASRYPHLRCFELDTPGMHAHKLAVIRAAYGELPVNLYAIGADLGQVALERVLSSHPAFDPTQRTVFVAEGVVMYLVEQDVKSLLSGLGRVCRVAYSLVFTAIEISSTKESGWGKYARDMLLGLRRERFSWGMPQAHMAAFLAEQGLLQQYQLSYIDLQRSWRAAEELAMLGRQSGAEYITYAVANRGM